MNFKTLSERGILIPTRLIKRSLRDPREETGLEASKAQSGEAEHFISPR